MSQRNIGRLVEEAIAGRYTRRMALKRAAALGLSAPGIAAVLAACGGAASTPTPTPSGPPAAAAGGSGTTTSVAAPATSGASAPSYANGTRGGTLRVALESDVPTMDMPFTTRNVVGAVIWCIFESLFAYDDKFQLIPMLAESDTISDDQLTHTIKLRHGVKFHNGDEMKAADVLASITRWMGLTPFAAPLKAKTKNLTQVDDYTIKFELSAPFGTLGHALAMNNGACPIYPKAVCDKAGQQQITEFVGTGPYKFVERQPDRFIRFARFDDYSALPGEARGYGGHKYAYVDKIEFTPVTDEAARVAGAQSGDYDFVRSITGDQYDTLKGSANLAVEILPVPWSASYLPINLKSPLLGNPTLRQAIQAAINCEDVLVTQNGKGFYRLSPGLMFKETRWYADEGQALYNRNDPVTAKKLLQQAGYDGTPIRFTVNTASQNVAIVVQKQLESVGFKVDLQALETNAWEKVTLTTNDWELCTNGYGFKPDPTQVPITQMCPYQGHWCDQDSVALMDKVYSEADFNARYTAWTGFQKNFYDQVPYVKFGDNLIIEPRSTKLKGASQQTALGILFWNMWLAK
jgi:peptide/nickel transport system substrate-binding protein